MTQTHKYAKKKGKMINWQKLDVEKRKGVDENKEKAQALRGFLLSVC